MNNSGYIPGLEGVVAAQTQLSGIDGQRGELIIGGYSLEELAVNASHEEAAFLLWYGRLPTIDDLHDFQRRLAQQRTLPAATVALLRSAAAQRVPVMDALRMACGTVSLDTAADDDLSLTLLARFPTIVAAYWRLQQGEEPIPSHESLGHAANYLYMLDGAVPGAARVRGLETYLNTVSDHGLNASTFAARVIISTGSDVASAVTGALGALKGWRHGGAPGPALQTVFEIGAAERAETVLRQKLAQGERLMGFGHRVYKVRDPRAVVLAAAAEELYRTDGNMALYSLAKAVEETALRLLAEVKPGRNLQTNVEFYTALLLHGLGLETELFTPTFAVGRVAGWIAHCFEERENGRLIRPQSVYVGVNGQRWTPIGER